VGTRLRLHGRAHSFEGQRNDHRPPRLNGFWSLGRVILKVTVLAPWPKVAAKLVGPVFCFLAESIRRNSAHGPLKVIGAPSGVAWLKSVTCASGRPLTVQFSCWAPGIEPSNL